jgi:hypothetical protein
MQQTEISVRFWIEFEILHVRQTLGSCVKVLTAVLQRESFQKK